MQADEFSNKILKTKGNRNIYDIGKPYVPEVDYKANEYRPLGQPKEHFCVTCKNYYQDLYDSGITKKPFPIKCNGDLSQKIEEMIHNGEIDEEEKSYFLYRDPVTFAASEFNWGPRFYQVPLLRCTAKFKVVRAGRRIGKTAAMAVDILHKLYINTNYNILVVCPYQSQVKRIFDIMRVDLISNAIDFNESVVRDNSSAPQIIELANGSKVTGFSSGAKSGGKSNQIRGQDANAIYLDEMDYLSEDDYESILAIITSHPDCYIWASSTPTGLRGKFFTWCTDKNAPFKEFHVISREGPSWNDETEAVILTNYSEAGFLREFLAEFGDEMVGVFKNSDINKSIRNYTYSECKPVPGFRYVMGVDWNEVSGVHIVITQLSGDANHIEYKVVCKEIIEKQSLTQHVAVKKIIDLDAIWNCAFIYADEGFGRTQIEMLHKYGLENPSSRLHIKVKAYNMASKVEIIDPLEKIPIKKDAKPFMVNVAAMQLECSRCIFPASEDTNVPISEEGTEGAIPGILQQMRLFKVDKIAKNGMPTYSQGFEHTLTAWMLSIVGFVLEMSDINQVSYDLKLGYLKKLGQHSDIEIREISKDAKIGESSKDLKKKYMPTSRGLSSDTMFSIWRSKSVYDILTRDKTIREIDKKKDQRKPYISKPKTSNRKTF